MSESPSKRRKKIVLVNRDFQFRFSGIAVIVGLASTVLTALIILFPLYKFEILKFSSFLPLPILSVVVVAALVNISLVGVMGIFLSHKIAGPMYSLVRSLREVEEGRWNSHLTTREDDELGYIVRNFNGMTKKLTQSMEMDLEDLEKLNVCIENGGITGRDLELVKVTLESVVLRLKDRIGNKDVKGSQAS